MMYKFLPAMLTPVFFLTGCTGTEIPNPCITDYPALSKEIHNYPSGVVARIEDVEWFEDGVKRITLNSGSIIMVRPLNLPMPSIGSDLELRSFTKIADEAPFAGCYCQSGTEICLEEYTYQ